MRMAMDKEDFEPENVISEVYEEQIDSFIDIDEAILASYNKRSDSFKKALSFDSFYNAHWSKIYADDFIKSNNQKDNALIQESESNEDFRKCKKCNQREASYHNKYCYNCEQELREAAKQKEREIFNELVEDSEFAKCSSQDNAYTHARTVFAADKEKNEFIALKQISKDAYYKMKK